MLNLKVGPCPKCGNNTFNVTAHVTQTWLVDEDGDFIKAESDSFSKMFSQHWALIFMSPPIVLALSHWTRSK